MKAQVFEIMHHDAFDFELPEDIAQTIFGDNVEPEVAARAKAQFFGDLNRTLREHCILTGQRIVMAKRYGLIPTLLAFWDDFRLTLAQLARQVATIFDDNNKDPKLPYGVISHQIQSQILHFGHLSWRRYILNQRFVAEDLLSDIALFVEKPVSYPFHNYNVATRVLTLLSRLPDKDFELFDYDIARVIAQFLKLFSKHQYCYPKNMAIELQEAEFLADSLFVYMKHCPREFLNAKAQLINRMKRMEAELESFSEMRPPVTFSLFDNFAYVQVMKMLRKCDPEEYIEKQIPAQIKYIASNHMPSDWRPEKVFPAYKNAVLPMFESAVAILKDSPRAVRSFCEQFCAKMFPIKLLEGAEKLFDVHSEYLHCVWQMTSHLPPYVRVLSSSLISYYKGRLASAVRRKNEELLQGLVAEINGLVGGEFRNHPSMVLARSGLLIPHQRDRELIGRARVLIEQAHNPSRMKYSIAELFDIVPWVKDKRDLFKGITDFIQNQLLARIDPSVELERSLVDAMGQYTEAEYISPLQNMLKEFADRYNMFEQASKWVDFGPGVRIALLSNIRWKPIVTRGVLFHEMDSIRRKFEDQFMKCHRNSQVIWCDPSSVVEVQIVIDGEPLLFLFNGVQYAIVRKVLSGPARWIDFVGAIQVDDLHEQVATLVETGLICESEHKTTYTFTPKYDKSTYRNFAQKYKSAANLALLDMKEQDRKRALASMIVSVVKAAGEKGIKIKEIISQVQRRAFRYFPVTPDMVREEARILEVTKYIKPLGDGVSTFVYVP